MTSRQPITRSFAIRFITGLAGAALVAGTVSLAAAQQSGRSGGNGHLADLMLGAQVGHIKLWFAGKNQNWELAAYEARQIKMRLQDAASLYESLPVDDVTTMAKPLGAVSAAIAAKDGRKFARAYDELTAGCNSCHQAVKLGFIGLQEPGSHPFTDQVFTPPRK